MMSAIFLVVAVEVVFFQATSGTEPRITNVSGRQTLQGKNDIIDLELWLQKLERNFQALEKHSEEQLFLITSIIKYQKAFDPHMAALEESVETLLTNHSRQDALELQLGMISEHVQATDTHIADLGAEVAALKGRILACSDQEVFARLENLTVALGEGMCALNRPATEVWTVEQDSSVSVTDMYSTSSSLSDSSDQPPIIFIRRQDGSEDFDRTYVEYQDGFGNESGEFWLGLERLHQITSSGQYRLLVNLTDWSGELKWAVYNSFAVAGESDGYRLNIDGYDPSSTARDGMKYNDRRLFTTKDRDRDGTGLYNCAERWTGGWWYGFCSWVHPTGLYKPAGYEGLDGITWYDAFYDWRSFNTTVMTLIHV